MLSYEVVAEAELSELRFANARTELERIPPCDEPLSLRQAQVEAELAQVDGTRQSNALVRNALDRVRTERRLSKGEQALLDAIDGRFVSGTEPAASRVLLNRAIAVADTLDVDDGSGARARTYAYKVLLELGAVDLDDSTLLALFATASRTSLGPGCALGALVDGKRLLLLARDGGGRFERMFNVDAFNTPDFDAHALVPPRILAMLSSCPRVDVLALAPLYGQPRLLPIDLAWSYRGPAGRAQPLPAVPKLLTIREAQPPAALGLSRLESPLPGSRGSGVDELVVRDSAATPERVRRELPLADFAEIHAHGFVDLGISDASLIALSPGADGTFALTARSIAGLKLSRAPFVTLAACHAAYTAPYLHEPWSLPYAFLLAGARGVLAPATEIPDKDANAFFQTVGDEILRGRDPAMVLREQRLQRRGRSNDWVNDVVLFD